MATLRKPWTGILHIIRFNWPFYALAAGAIFILLLVANTTINIPPGLIYGAVWIVALPTLISLLVSWYVYDLSGLYLFNWLVLPHPPKHILNLHAGFDETSVILHAKYPEASLTVMDFYNPAQHTEPSIERARKAYPPPDGTLRISTSQIPADAKTYNSIFLVFAAHEIRNHAERITFFKELRRVAADNATIHVVEHLRDLPNFIAYNIGFFHFFSAHTWLETFAASGLSLVSANTVNPFVKYYILQKNDPNSH